MPVIGSRPVLGDSPGCDSLPDDSPRGRWLEDKLVVPSRVRLLLEKFARATVCQSGSSESECELPGIPAALLTGPPGGGKTSVGRAVVGSVARHEGQSVKVVELACSSIFSSGLGDSSKQVEAVFSRAASLASVGHRVLIEANDIEGAGLARTRSAGPANPNDTVQVVTTFLACLDRLAGCAQVACIANTNHVELLDDALLDRFGLVIDLPAPDFNARLLILLQYMGGRTCRFLRDSRDQIEAVLKRTEHMSARALATRLIQTAVFLSGRQASELSCRDLNNALDILPGGKR